MSKNLLNVQSFQQSQGLLSAINTLSIHRKLNLNGYPDLNRKDAAEQSQETLIAFFQKLDKIAQDIEDRHPKHVLGVNVRLRHLAENYVQARRNPVSLSSPLGEHSLSQVGQLFDSGCPEDCRQALEILAAFRELLEEHVSVDAQILLGEI
jgi:hypothetical protein